MMTTPRYDWYTHEWFFNDRWYDGDDPVQMEMLDMELEEAREREELEADYLYQRRKDEGR